MYHEARRHHAEVEKRSKAHREHLKRRRERQGQRGARDPTRSLMVEGRACKLLRATAEGVGRLEEALMPWQGRQDTMVDRFDVRTVMDHVGEYEAKEKGPRRGVGERCVCEGLACVVSVLSIHCVDELYVLWTSQTPQSTPQAAQRSGHHAGSGLLGQLRAVSALGGGAAGGAGAEPAPGTVGPVYMHTYMPSV